MVTFYISDEKQNMLFWNSLLTAYYTSSTHQFLSVPRWIVPEAREYFNF